MWGTIFAGVSACATVGAVGAAVIAGRHAKRLFEVEAARDLRAEAVERRRHATQVNAWAAVRIPPQRPLVYGIVVRNSSNDPVYDLRITCHGFTAERTHTLRCIPPGAYFIPNEDNSTSRGGWDYARPVREIDDPVRPFTASDNKRVDAFEFRDHAGIMWRRTARGELAELSDHDAQQ